MSSENTNEHTEQIIGLTDLMVKTLQATIDADRSTAEEYYRILEENSFVQQDEDGPSELQMVDVRIRNQNGQTQIISVPKMILMPVPMLHISEATFEIGGTMCLNTTESSNEEVKEDSTASNTAQVQTARGTRSGGTRSGGRVTLPNGKSRYMDSIAVRLPSNTSKETSSSTDSSVESGQSTTNLKISVKMTQSDMPSGLVNLLQVMTNNIQVKNE